MGLATLSVNHAAALVNVKSVHEVAENLFGIYDKLKPLIDEDIVEAMEYIASFSDDTRRAEVMKAKLDDEAVAISTAGHQLNRIADAMQETVDLFTAEHLEEIRMSSAGVHSFVGQGGQGGGVDTVVFKRGTTITGS